jgi:hypothetical protein
MWFSNDLRGIAAAYNCFSIVLAPSIALTSTAGGLDVFLTYTRRAVLYPPSRSSMPDQQVASFGSPVGEGMAVH